MGSVSLGVEVWTKRRDGTMYRVRSGARGATKRPEARKETQRSLGQGQRGGILSGEHAGNSKWCLAVMFRIASVWLQHGRVVDCGWG